MANNGNDNWSQQIIPDLLIKSLKTVKGGAVDIDMEGHSALRIEVNKEREKINIDFIHPDVIQVAESERKDRTGLFDKLKTAKRIFP
jgi:hypothetical protein